IERDIHDLALDADDAALFGFGAKESRIEARIEMEGVIDRPVPRAALEPPGLRRLRFETILPRVGIAAFRHMAQPMLVETDAAHVHAETAARTEIVLSGAGPVTEFEAELDRPPRRAEEGVLVDLEQLVELADRSDRRSAHADDAGRVGFDQRDA